MKLTFDTLRKHLSGEPARAYLVSGDEALLVGEAADAIRAAAKRAGFEEREVFFIERVADWEAVRGATNNLSLFGSRKLIEIRLPSGKPGTGGSNAIGELLGSPNPDNIYLMLTGKLEREQAGAAWVKAFETAGAWLPIWPVDVAALPQWLRNRAAAMEVQLDDKAVQLIVERTEGNLLAAHQELQKLKLTIPDGKVGVETVQASLGDSARFAAQLCGAQGPCYVVSTACTSAARAMAAAARLIRADLCDAVLCGTLALSPDRSIVVWTPREPLPPLTEHLLEVDGLRDARGRAVARYRSGFVAGPHTLDELGRGDGA